MVLADCCETPADARMIAYLQTTEVILDIPDCLKLRQVCLWEGDRQLGKWPPSEEPVGRLRCLIPRRAVGLDIRVGGLVGCDDVAVPVRP